MVTYQDLLKIGENEKDRIDFVRKAITDHMQSNLYKQAARAYKYYDGENETLMNYQKTLVKITGEVIPDKYATNHKAPSNFIELFVTQQNQYLLGNGISWNKGDETKKRLGNDFDSVVQDAGENALLGTVSFGFWNLDHVELFVRTYVGLYFLEEYNQIHVYFFLVILPSRFSLKSSDLLRHTKPLLCGTHRHLPYTRISATVARFPRKNLLTISCFSWSLSRSRPMMPKADVLRTIYPSTTLPHFLHLNFWA